MNESHVHDCGGLCECAHAADPKCPACMESPLNYEARVEFFRERYGEDAWLCADCEFPFRSPFSHVHCND